MPYTITGTATFSSQANRDSARTRLDTALLAYSLVNTATVAFSAGITQPTTTTMTVSFTVPDGTDAGLVAKAIYDAWIGTGGAARHTLGYLSVNKT